MREIVFDTETTGVKALQGDRIVEIGAVELVNSIPSGRSYHVYINPERDMPKEAEAIHGLSTAFLSDKPVFADVIEAFLDFVDGDRLVAHNAGFDLGFLNAELDRLERQLIPQEQVFDTLALARRRFPGAPNSLDALCQRFGIDNGARVKHGALLDAELLAEVYLELCGGRQSALSFTPDRKHNGAQGGPIRRAERPEPLPSTLSEAEREAHRAFVASFGAASLWLGEDEKTSPGRT